MPSIKDFVDAMSATWPAALAILIAALALLASDYLELRYLAIIPPWVPAAAFIAAILSASVLTVSTIRVAGRLAMMPIWNRRLAKHHAEHIALLEDLPQPEAALLAWAAANSTQVMTAPYFNPHVKALVAKGFLQIPGGSHQTDAAPFHIPSHIWKALRDEIEKNPSAFQELIGWQPFKDRC